MPKFDYDLFVLGAGSGGVRASRMSASYGARVAVAEERYLGGTCVNVGCVPKKLFVYASEVAEEIRHARGFGWSVDKAEFDWPTLRSNKDTEIQRLNGIYERLLADAGVMVFDGRARLVDARTVAVGEKTFTAENILVAVGGWPLALEIPGAEHAVSSNEVFHWQTLPRRIVIVGGGYIAAEFASILNGLGVETTLLYRGPLFLRGFDEEIRRALAEEMREKGVDVRFGIRPRRIDKTEQHLEVELDDASVVETDAVLAAIGRQPMTRDLGLEAAGVKLGAGGEICVDGFGRTSAPSVWAIGDVTDRLNLTPVAIHEGMCLAKTLFADKPTKPDHSDVATAVFTQPTIGTVGLTEEEARDLFEDVEVYRSRFRPLKLTLTDDSERTMVKLVVDRSSDRVVGAHMLGPGAGEIIQGIAIAVRMGATKDDFDATIGIHPTTAEEFVTLRDPS